VKSAPTRWILTAAVALVLLVGVGACDRPPASDGTRPLPGNRLPPAVDPNQKKQRTL
jgi:hypothetical protein